MTRPAVTSLVSDERDTSNWTPILFRAHTRVVAPTSRAGVVPNRPPKPTKWVGAGMYVVPVNCAVWTFADEPAAGPAIAGVAL